MEIPYKIMADAIDPNIKYFKAASELLSESLFKATKTYRDNDWSSIDKYNKSKSFEEVISSMPKTENKSKIGYSNKFNLLFLM